MTRTDESFESFAADAAASQPQPSPESADVLRDAQAAHAAEAPEVASATVKPGAPDRVGTPYNPAYHASPPTLSTRGTWKLRRRGDAPPQAAPHVDEAPPQSGSDPAPQILAGPVVDSRAVAESWADMFFAAMAMMIGPEWEPTPTERSKITDALEKWHRAAGITADLPPGWALIVAVALYAIPRFKHPDTRSKVAGVIGRVKNFIPSKRKAA